MFPILRGALQCKADIKILFWRLQMLQCQKVRDLKVHLSECIPSCENLMFFESQFSLTFTNKAMYKRKPPKAS